jgi:invasion protein IalB
MEIDMRIQNATATSTFLRCLAWIWCAALLLSAACGPAGAEEAGVVVNEAPAACQATQAEVAPRGQRAVKDIKYGDWRKVCFKTPGTNTVCRTTISGVWDTGQLAVRADVIERQGDATPRLQLFLPTGLYLQAGVKIRVDQGQQRQVPFVWCLTNTCIAAEAIASPSLQEMETGHTLLLEVIDSNVLSISTSLPLDRFAATRNGTPAELYQQDIDE